MLPMYEIRNSDLTVNINKYELKFPEHMHKYVELVYAFEGEQRLCIDSQNYTVEEGNAAIIFPDTIHSYQGSGESGSRILILMCAPKLFGALFPDLNNLRPQNPIIEKEHICPELKFALGALKCESDFNIKFSWTCVIMSYVMNILKLEHHAAATVEDLSYKIIRYLEENFTENITRESLAKKFNVSECYISKIFARSFKINLRNYLGLMRAEYAANLIRTTNETFTSISQLAGFQSLRTFNRIFRAAYDMSPMEYRNNLNKFIKTE